MSLWSSATILDSAEKSRLLRLSQAWVRVGQYWKVPCKSSITEARQRVGPRVMSGAGDAPPPVSYFMTVVRPLATDQTPAALIGGVVVWWQWTEPYWMCQIALRSSRVFGYPGTRPGSRAAFPKIRLVVRNCCPPGSRSPTEGNPDSSAVSPEPI